MSRSSDYSDTDDNPLRSVVADSKGFLPLVSTMTHQLMAVARWHMALNTPLITLT
jgi:hypothetical protein